MGSIILKIFYNCTSNEVHISFNIFWTSGVIILFILLMLIYKKINLSKNKKIIPIEMTFSVGGSSVKYQIVRNYNNILIANKIYIELITRKAAIKINEKDDLISDIYDSWYSLFQITRIELKNIPGELLINNSTSNELMSLVTDILNKGLRPHLTKYQARFRKWYNQKINLEEYKELSPQEIQKDFPDYAELIQSMKEVNELLIEYSIQLKKIIDV